MHFKCPTGVQQINFCPLPSVPGDPLAGGLAAYTEPNQDKSQDHTSLDWRTLKVTASHSPRVAQRGGPGSVQVQMQVSTPQTCTVGRKNMHVVCVMGVGWGDRQTDSSGGPSQGEVDRREGLGPALLRSLLLKADHLTAFPPATTRPRKPKGSMTSSKHI